MIAIAAFFTLSVLIVVAWAVAVVMVVGVGVRAITFPMEVVMV